MAEVPEFVERALRQLSAEDLRGIHGVRPGAVHACGSQVGPGPMDLSGGDQRRYGPTADHSGHTEVDRCPRRLV